MHAIRTNRISARRRLDTRRPGLRDEYMACYTSRDRLRAARAQPWACTTSHMIACSPGVRVGMGMHHDARSREPSQESTHHTRVAEELATHVRCAPARRGLLTAGQPRVSALRQQAAEAPADLRHRQRKTLPDRAYVGEKGSSGLS